MPVAAITALPSPDAVASPVADPAELAIALETAITVEEPDAVPTVKPLARTIGVTPEIDWLDIAPVDMPVESDGDLAVAEDVPDAEPSALVITLLTPDTVDEPEAEPATPVCSEPTPDTVDEPAAEPADPTKDAPSPVALDDPAAVPVVAPKSP